jgi:uncharacterized membrane protein YdbT with pleckstrin-like domain
MLFLRIGLLRRVWRKIVKARSDDKERGYTMRTPIPSDETIIIEARRHWITLVGPSVQAIIAIMIIIAVFSTKIIPLFKIIIAVFISVAFLWFLLKLSAALCHLHFNIWVLTDRRLIQEWGVISRHFDETPLNRICNVSFDQSWGGRLWDYGTVAVQTAGETGYDSFPYLANPKLYVSELDKARKANEQGGADLIHCPHCDELVKSKAQVCKWCGRDIATNTAWKSATD